MRRTHIAAPLILVALVGCGSEEDRIKLVPVKGTVTQNGEPLAGATITFVPDASNADSTPGVDATGPEGNYMAKFKSRTGLAPGKYRVTVMPPLVMPSGAKVPEEFKDDPYMAQMAMGIDPGAPTEGVAGEQSEFEAEVPPEGGTFDFDVKKANK